MERIVPFSMNLGGRLVEYTRPAVMGIVNATPDSFYSLSRVCAADARSAVERMAADGADIIDIGACSTRHGSKAPSAQEEIDRLGPVIEAARASAPEIPVSVDTYRADVARAAVEQMGAAIVNDISGGELDPDMLETVARLRVPYILTHTRGNPETMQSLADYSAEGGVVAAVISDLSHTLNRLKLLGVADVIVDPGLGFAKTVEQSYELIASLPAIIAALGCPVLIGASRKSMIYKPLGIDPADALNATTALNAIALTQGASILRVHDVKAARQAVDIYTLSSTQHLSSL